MLCSPAARAGLRTAGKRHEVRAGRIFDPEERQSAPAMHTVPDRHGLRLDLFKWHWHAVNSALNRPGRRLVRGRCEKRPDRAAPVASKPDRRAARHSACVQSADR